MYGDAITVVQLAYVRAAADLGSFSKAAVSLGVTQPALSNGVSSLERTIGGALFTRSTTGATLTEIGRRVLPHFLKMLGAVENVAAEIQDERRDTVPLRVGVSPLIHPRMIARALEAASRNHLGPLVLREENLVPLREALTSRRLDLVFVPSVPGSSRFARRILESEPVHYLSRSDGDDNSAVELTAVAAAQLVMVGDTCGLTTFTNSLVASLDCPIRKYPGEADSYATLQDWGALGLGGVVLPISKYSTDTVTRPIVRDGIPITISYEAIWDANSAQSDTIIALLDAMFSSPRGGVVESLA